MLQRVSAVYLAVFLAYVLARFWLYPHPDFNDWHAWFSQPAMTIASAGCVLALLSHAWVGLRDVVLDYIHHLGLRLVTLTLIAFLLAGCGFWAVRTLLVVSAPA